MEQVHYKEEFLVFLPSMLCWHLLATMFLEEYNGIRDSTGEI